MLSNVLAETRDRSAYILLMNKSRKSYRKLRLFFCAVDTALIFIVPPLAGERWYGVPKGEGLSLTRLRA